MNWKLIICVASGVTASVLVTESFFGSINLLLVALAAIVSLAGGILLSLILRIGSRKPGTSGVK